MRAVLQRVLQASVEVNGQQISKIKQGLCVLVGLSVDDTSADIDFMVRKLLSVRVFDSSHNAQSSASEDGGPQDSSSDASAPPKMWAKSVVDIGGEILCVSQFTLYGQVLKGSKPDFHLSMKSETSKQMYHDFLDRLKRAYHPDRIKDGEFGAMMLVNIANDGPVTLELDSRKFEYVPVTAKSSPVIAKSNIVAKAKPEKNKQAKSKFKGDKPEKETVRDGEGVAVEEVAATAAVAATVTTEEIETEIEKLSLPKHTQQEQKS
ncbi:D-tyrosyl-tRNA deacylase 1-like protein [Dissophora ornata]|nr:D-tyrosyl-tRNA(Tyr) deacylase [Dissophora ornata]KAI8598101.1 D-tyrosyl-tRNA deacylase 1-like protein [Dissophora ornata]